MDLIVTELPGQPLETDLFGDQYPGHQISEITNSEKEAINEAMRIRNYISPLPSIHENQESDEEIEDSDQESDDTLSSLSQTHQSKNVSIRDYSVSTRDQSDNQSLSTLPQEKELEFVPIKKFIQPEIVNKIVIAAIPLANSTD